MSVFNSWQFRSFVVCMAFLLAGRFASMATAQSTATEAKANKPRPVISGPAVTGSIQLPEGEADTPAKVYLLKRKSGSYSLPRKPLTTTADRTGRFAFDAVKPGKYRIWAETEKFTSLKKKLGGKDMRVEESSPADAHPLTLKLHPGCGYDVAIHDAETKAPIENARISFGWTDIKREYKTGKEGLAKIRQLAVDDWYFVIKADGYGTVFKKISKQKLGTVLPMRFDLKPGGTLAGTLRDQNGDPIADARISISLEDVSMTPGFGRIVTDEKGDFSVKGMPVGRPLRLYSTKEGYIGGRYRCAVIGGDKPTRADFVSKKRPYGGDVLVTVLDEKGEPIADATLFNRGSNSGNTRKGRTDESGTGKLQDVFARHAGFHVVVKADGYIAQRVPVEPGTIENPAELTVDMKPGRTLTGRIVKPDGEPASGLRVYFNEGHHMNDVGGRVETDKDGKFEIRGLPDPSTLTVYVPKEFEPVDELEVPLESDNDVTIELQIAGVLRVRAMDSATDKPIPEFNVKIGFCEHSLPGDPSPGGISSSLVDQGVNVQGTQKEYRLEGQTVGVPYKLIVSAKGYETTTLRRVVAEPADTAELLDVELDSIDAADYQTVAGRLVDADDKPIVGASVRLLLGYKVPKPDERGRNGLEGWRFYHWGLLSRDDIENRDMCAQYLKTVSDENGKFEFADVKAGVPWMELFYFGENMMSQRFSNLSLRPEEELTDLKLTAERPATVTVHIDGKAYPDVHSVELQAEDYSRGRNAVELAYSYERRVLEDGQVEVVFKNIPHGQYKVRLVAKPVVSPDGDGFTTSSVGNDDVTVKEGEDHVVEFAPSDF